MEQIVGTITNRMGTSQYTRHIPLVIQHWEQDFRRVYALLRKEAALHDPTPPGLPRLCMDNAYYAFERYYIVMEFDIIGTPLRIFFPDEATELLIMLKA